MKISGRTVLIGLATLLIVGATISYYFSINQKGESLGWESSNWLYRKTFEIPNNGSMAINKTVSINLDTKSLITTNKLQTDCDDLRFLDSDESTALQYWIKDQCNTTSTEILIRIPSLPKDGKTIYILYGNPTALNAQEQLTIGN